MSFKAIFTLALSIWCSGLFAQAPIVDAKKYKRGIYKTFEEFQNNAPSIPLDYQTRPMTKSYGLMGTGGKVPLKRVIISRKEGKQIGEMYGFSDGKDLYINHYKPRLGPKTNFFKVTYLGEYAYFRGLGHVGDSNTRYLDEILIKMTDGEEFYLNKDSIRRIIEDDHQIITAYNTDVHGGSRLRYYVVRYLEKKKADGN